MAANFSGGLIGLSMLTGTNAFAGSTFGIRPESRAVREARALFTTAPVVAPWQIRPESATLSAQAASIKRLVSIIDKPSARDTELSPDIQTAFTAYKALDRLRVLAELASGAGTGGATRALMQPVFAKGLADLQEYLAAAPTDQLRLSFDAPSRRAQGVTIPRAPVGKVLGDGILADRFAPIPDIAGTEVLKLTLSKYGETETLTIDLAQTPQPPTLDSIAQAFNAAIAGVPARDAAGTALLDSAGNPIPKYQAEFGVDKGTGKWGLALNNAVAETVAIDQVSAKDALIVATGSTALDAPGTTSIHRFDDPATALARQTIGSVAATDRDATAATGGTATAADESKTVWAMTKARAIATAADGSSYVVGTTAGDLGANLSSGQDDLFLTKLNSEGKIVWQRTLGAAGSSEGAAVTIAPDGDIVVAGTVRGPIDGSSGADAEMVVARFSTNGDEEFATVLRSVGDDRASAVAMGADGSIFVGGSNAGRNGDAFVARLSATGTLQERRLIDSGGSDAVTGLAVDASGELLALVKTDGTATVRRLDAQALATDLGSISLGAADARAIAVSASGEIAVAGSAIAPLSGTQVNTTAGGRDGFVARIDAGLSQVSTSYVGSGADDQIDSVGFMGDAIYAGGRTTGALDGARTGAVDGFVARIDSATGAVESVSQFGKSSLRTEPVFVSAAVGGAAITGRLGLHRSALNPPVSTSLVSQTAVRAGDGFAIRVGDGAIRKIAIEEDETLTSLAARIRALVGGKVLVTTPRVGEGNALRIDPKPGQSIELIAGPDGKDALAKLGMGPARIFVPVLPDDDAPKVQPGGSFGLSLKSSLSIATAKDAGAALDQVKQALSTTQTGFRSLYWDDFKAARVDGYTSGGGTPYQRAQLAKYQEALTRISSITRMF